MTIYLHSEAAVMDQGEIQRLLQDRMFDSVLLFCEFELSSSSSPSSSELAAKKRSGSDGCCVPPAVPRRQALHYYGKALKGKTEHRRAVGYFNDALELLKLELHFASEEAERDGGPETDEEVCSLRELQLQMEMEMAVCLLAEQEEEKAFLILANIPSQRRNARANMMVCFLYAGAMYGRGYIHPNALIMHFISIISFIRSCMHTNAYNIYIYINIYIYLYIYLYLHTYKYVYKYLTPSSPNCASD